MHNKPKITKPKNTYKGNTKEVAQKKTILKIYKILKTNYYKYKKQKNKDNIPKEKIFTNIRKNAD